MIEFSPYLKMSGEDFSPSRFEKSTGMIFSEKIERGDIGVRGRWKDKPIPYGMGVLEVPNTVPKGERFSWLLGAAVPHSEQFSSQGAEIILHLCVAYKNQCNMEFTPEEILKIGKLGANFTISCYEDDDLKDELRS